MPGLFVACYLITASVQGFPLNLSRPVGSVVAKVTHSTSGSVSMLILTAQDNTINDSVNCLHTIRVSIVVRFSV